ncbi:Phage terminase-like protein, large subunit, contains N-terminal HTH domain [Nitrosospira sp. Nsp11]|uniref:terminase large subunit n=1 Tax=Nitrosospira sp. Nsp11 TaxID=1855338 RepID=UPI00091D93AF|nr:terminase TerL endonuclease subunit [Nitrosospira sp. Nsp11]SHL10645.1 Phage terminase-like protein, large subunit, contains N-terminal HTH domain [Nitrosospira sp. Nsp11]
MSFAAIATQYAQDVVDGKISSCKWHRLACQRHLNDLVRSKTTAWPYVFNAYLVDVNGKMFRSAERICRFAELMPHIKGDWASRGERLKLKPWEVFVLASVFGWVDRTTLRRRFRTADLFVPRKNAKSTLAAVIGNYMLAVDGEFGAEVYSGATSQDQAFEVFKPAQLMALRTDEYRARYGVSVHASNLAVIATNSKFEPVIGKPGDGASPSCAIVDEFHEHKTPELYDTMQTGMGARSQPLMLVITTSGSDISGPCFMHQVELQKILEGVIENERRFGIIFTVDEGDDWTSEDALIKANPNFGISVDAEFLKAQQRDAITDPRKQNVFKTKHLNIWVAAASPWINLYNLQRAGDVDLKEEDFRHESCVVGLDLASKNDIASKVKLFKRAIKNVDHYYAFSRNYIPQAQVDKPENTHYSGWVHQGHLIATDGNMISLRQIEEEIVSDSDNFPITEIAMDPVYGREIAPSLQEQGFTVVDIPQRVMHLTDAMKLIAALIDAGRFHHDGNPAFVWMMSNVEVKPDRNENIFPRKLRAENKIDAAVALINAMCRAMAGQKSNIIDQGFVAL